jgi:hypothetical protein
MINKEIDNIAKILGAKTAPSIQQLTLYIPDKDKNGKQIKNRKRWLKESQQILTYIGGGTTAFPPADGTWLNPENNTTVWEKTTIIYTYIDPDKFEKHLPLLKKYLHRFGRETNQGEVVFEFDGRFYKISKYDPQ